VEHNGHDRLELSKEDNDYFYYYFVPLFPLILDVFMRTEIDVGFFLFFFRCWIFNLNSRVDVVRFIDMGVSKYLDNNMILLYKNLT